MTVRELIQCLAELPQDIKVMCEREGCCLLEEVSHVDTVEFDSKTQVVVIL